MSQRLTCFLGPFIEYAWIGRAPRIGGVEHHVWHSMQPEEHKQGDYADLLKLSDNQFHALVAVSMSSGDDGGTPAASSGANKRESGRLRFTFGKSIPITLQESNGALRNVRAYPIDISQSGMALFVGMFVHAKTKVCATLTFNDGERLIINGTCVNCRMVSGRAHRIGVQFVKAFDMTLLLSPDQTATLAPPKDDALSAQKPLPESNLGNPIPISSVMPTDAAASSATPPVAGGAAPPSPPAPGEPSGLSEAELGSIKQATQELLGYVTGFAERIRSL